VIPRLATYVRTSDVPAGTLLCLHGGLDRAVSFSRLARRIEGLNVVAYDRRDIKAAARAPRRAWTSTSKTSLMLSVPRTGPTIVLGHSYGGVVAMAAACQRPELFAHIVAYESPLPWIYRRPGFVSDLGSIRRSRPSFSFDEWCQTAPGSV
jgi:pimeloyl-ACP methyl ester carboxylesterase